MNPAVETNSMKGTNISHPEGVEHTPYFFWIMVTLKLNVELLGYLLCVTVIFFFFNTSTF